MANGKSDMVPKALLALRTPFKIMARKVQSWIPPGVKKVTRAVVSGVSSAVCWVGRGIASAVQAVGAVMRIIITPDQQTTPLPLPPKPLEAKGQYATSSPRQARKCYACDKPTIGGLYCSCIDHLPRDGMYADKGLLMKYKGTPDQCPNKLYGTDAGSVFGSW